MKLWRWWRVPLAALLAVSFVVLGTELPVHACAFPMVGDGSSANPWEISTQDHLTCLTPGTTFVRAGGVHFILTADLEWRTVLPITQPNMVSFDGGGHSITVKNISNFVGLFGNPSGITVSNLVVVPGGTTTLRDEAGWLASDDTNGTYSNILVTGSVPMYGGGVVGMSSSGTRISDCTSTGSIDAYGGGVVGSYVSNVQVERCVSTGSIGNYSGGIVGFDAGDGVVVSKSYSTGSIAFYAGGIVGTVAASNANDAVIVSNSFSSGNIGLYGGGIVGHYAASGSDSSVTVTKSFSTGSIANYAGGIAGSQSAHGANSTAQFSNVYSTGSLSMSDCCSDLIYGPRVLVSGSVLSSNDYSLNLASWSDAYANAALAGTGSPFGSTWGSCAVNTPYFLSAFYPRNPCVDALATNVTVSKPAASVVVSASSVVRPENDMFSMASTIASSPLSHVAVVNGTGSVSLDGVSCTTATSCVMPDVTQGPSSRGQFLITDSGTVTVKRFDVFTRTTSDVGTLSVERTSPPVVATAPSVTLNLDANGGTCQTSFITGISGTTIDLPSPLACTRAGRTFAGWNTDRAGKGSFHAAGSSIVLGSGSTLFAQWSDAAASPPPASSRISARISRLSRSPEWVKVSGRVAGTPRLRGLQVWFRESGSARFVKSDNPLMRSGARFTWFHNTSKAVQVYLVADSGIRSRTVRISAPTVQD